MEARGEGCAKDCQPDIAVATALRLHVPPTRDPTHKNGSLRSPVIRYARIQARLESALRFRFSRGPWVQTSKRSKIVTVMTTATLR